jgi:phosphopentomutase
LAQRVILLVMDSVGIGEMPDSHEYGDQGSNTLYNIAKAVGGLYVPNLQKLGIGNIIDLPSMTPR